MMRDINYPNLEEYSVALVRKAYSMLELMELFKDIPLNAKLSDIIEDTDNNGIIVNFQRLVENT